MSFVRFLARPMLASSFVLAGMDKLKNADDTAAQLSPLLRRAADALIFPGSPGFPDHRRHARVGGDGSP